RAEPLEPAELVGDRCERAVGLGGELAQPRLACLDLSDERAGPGIGLLGERPEVDLGRRGALEHLAHARDQSEVERLVIHDGSGATKAQSLPDRAPARPYGSSSTRSITTSSRGRSRASR